MGNRLTKSDSLTSGGTTTTTTAATFDLANRLTVTIGAGASTYTNDANGNPLTGGGRTLTWDSQNRMASCTKSSVTSTYTYGADGLRRSSTVNGITTYYVYDGQTMVREMKRGGDTLLHPSATYLQGVRGGECRIDETQQTEGYYDLVTHVLKGRGKTSWYVFDGLGSVVGEVDPSGNLTSSPKYDVYGAVRGNGGTASSKQGFVGNLGHVSDSETGLIYMRARYYDPQQGRFASQDPQGNGMNWFVYCNDNPVNSVDADGKIPILLVAALVGMIAAAVGDIAYQSWTKKGQIDWYEVLAMAVGGAIAGAVLTGIALSAAAVVSASTLAEAAMAVATCCSATQVGLAFTAWAVGMGVISGGVSGLAATAVTCALGRQVQTADILDTI